MHNCMDMHTTELLEAKFNAMQFNVHDFIYNNDLIKPFSEDAVTMLIPCLSKDTARLC